MWRRCGTRQSTVARGNIMHLEEGYERDTKRDTKARLYEMNRMWTKERKADDQASKHQDRQVSYIHYSYY